MIPRHFLAALVLALPVLVVTFAAVAGASLLASGMGDAAGARGLQWGAIAVLLLVVVDTVLLLAALGIRAVQEDDRPDR